MDEKEVFMPASFGVAKEHIQRYHDAYVHSKADEIRQLDILQEECAELIQALSKLKRIYGSSEADYTSAHEYYSTRSHLVEELAHVAISSAIVCSEFCISQGEIDAEVKRKDDLLTKPIFGFDESNGPDMTAGGTQL